MILTDSDSLYVLRSIALSDHVWLAETLEDFPINNGFTLVQAQNEITALRRMEQNDTGIGVVVEYDGNPVSFFCIAIDSDDPTIGHINIQATHPDHRQQGHGRQTTLLRGVIAFDWMDLSRLEYSVEQGNVAGEGLVASWNQVSSTDFDTTRPGVKMPDVTYNSSAFTAEDWANYLTANSINSDRFTVTE